MSDPFSTAAAATIDKARSDAARWTRCGTFRGYWQHRRNGEEPCAECAAKARPCSVEDCERAVIAREMCGMHYNRWKLAGTPVDPPQAARLKLQRAAVARLSTPEALEDGECWEWPGGRIPCGYGVVAPSLRVTSSGLAHRNAYAIAYGSIPDDLFACHRCDNRICYRPSHLFLGTNADNMQDMLAKGRANRPAQRKGSSNPKARFTVEEVQEIVRLRELGWLQREIGAHFGVSQSAISYLLRGKNGYLEEVAS